jgi:hypothetical protein
MKDIQTIIDDKIKSTYLPLFNENVSANLDGIVNIERYLNSKIKCLWILKDSNGFDENSIDNWDYRNGIYEASGNNDFFKNWSKTFTNIVYISQMILNNKTWDEVEYIRDNFSIVEILNDISVINIKKIPGKSSANENELKAYFDKYKDILEEQINLINPQVIICGMTFRYISELIEGFDENLVQQLDCTNFYIDTKNNRIYIDAYHPNFRVAGKTIKQYCEEITKIVKDHIQTQ